MTKIYFKNSITLHVYIFFQMSVTLPLRQQLVSLSSAVEFPGEINSSNNPKRKWRQQLTVARKKDRKKKIDVRSNVYRVTVSYVLSD